MVLKGVVAEEQAVVDLMRKVCGYSWLLMVFPDVQFEDRTFVVL